MWYGHPVTLKRVVIAINEFPNYSFLKKRRICKCFIRLVPSDLRYLVREIAIYFR